MNRTSLNDQVTHSYQRVVDGGFNNAAQHWKKGLLAILVTVTSVCTWELVAGKHGILAENKLNASNIRLEVENKALGRQVNERAEQNRQMATSDFYAEKAIRETLTRARPGEIVYLFNENPTGTNNTPLTFDDVRIVQAPPKKEPK